MKSTPKVLLLVFVAVASFATPAVAQRCVVVRPRPVAVVRPVCYAPRPVVVVRPMIVALRPVYYAPRPGVVVHRHRFHRRQVVVIR